MQHKFTALVAQIWGLTLYRRPEDGEFGYLHYITDEFELVASPWKTIPTEGEVAEWLQICPWEQAPLPILSYITKNS